jgi:methylphosphotriester-DNA--protein-cysteine methyltransferase
MLGDELSQALTTLTQLITKTAEPWARQALLAQHEQLAGALQVFIDRLVEPTLPEYAEATKALKAANRLAAAAKTDLDQLAATLESMAKAVRKVAALAVAVGLG